MSYPSFFFLCRLVIADISVITFATLNINFGEWDFIRILMSVVPWAGSLFLALFMEGKTRHLHIFIWLMNILVPFLVGVAVLVVFESFRSFS